MGEIIYEDLKRNYFLLDYSPSHSELVIRGFSGNGINIDLFFKNVQRINLNPKLIGIKITVENEINNSIIFNLTDNNGNVGHIHAGLFVEFNNSLGMLQTCLGDFTWTKENKEISFFPTR